MRSRCAQFLGSFTELDSCNSNGNWLSEVVLNPTDSIVE
jgi:predicted RNase H-like HicB family nuclease